jgi:hypothetical protein
MAVAVVSQFRVTQGRRDEFIKEAGVAKSLHEKLGGRVRMYNSSLAGPNTGIITYVNEFDDHAAYAAYTLKAQADQELQTFLARALGGANPAATYVSQSMLVEIPL